MADGDAIGTIERYKIEEKDNLYEVARRNDIGIVEILSANPNVDPWTPAPGTELTITGMHLLPPGERNGIVINLSELRLFYYTESGIMTFPIGIGREGWPTPVAKTKIVRKREHPIWTPPPSIRAENPELSKSFLPGPDNPLGDYALDLGIPGVLIHGTNRPYGIGRHALSQH
ncbi:MAG: L,D-transpeptidase family protein [Rickettsiales bacterium]